MRFVKPAPILRNYRRLMWLGGGKNVGRPVARRYRWIFHATAFQSGMYNIASKRERRR